MYDKAKIMDVTLRDGSYAINFQFSEYETEKISEYCNASEIDYIEIGHGMGIGASNADNGIALCTDVEYLSAARKGANNAKYGMFCIPSFTSPESIDVLKDYGASFVRVGANVTEIETTKEYIKRAKELGLEVMTNYMKSYAVSPYEFAERVKLSESYGADVVYLVDSSGSMNQHDIEAYYEAIRKVSSIRLGFHGHNNLGLAVSNTIFAAELGFDIVDTSMLGMGRSAGNAATELYLGNLLKDNSQIKYDLRTILECEKKIVKPLWKHCSNELDLYCGIARFHTSYMKNIRKFALKYRVNPLDLIINYSKYDRVNMDESVLEKIASTMESNKECVLTEFPFNEYFGDEQRK